MVKTGNSGGRSRSRGRDRNILEGVESSKKKKFQSKLEEFENKRDWSRDTYKDDYSELNNTIETVEELITDLQAEINRREGIGEGNKPKKQEIISDYGKKKLEDLQDLGGRYTPYLKEISDNEERLKELYKQVASWMAYRERLQEIAKEKMKGLTDQYKEEFVDSEVANRLLDWQEARQEKFEENIEDKIESEISNKFARHDEKLKNLEERVDEAKSEARTHRRMLQETIRALSESETDHEALVERLKQELEANKPSWMQQGNQDTQQRDTGDVPTQTQPSGNQIETESSSDTSDEKDIDEESVEELVADSSVPGEEVEEQESEEEEEDKVYELKGKDTDERYDVLERMVEENDFSGMSKSAVAEYVDVSRPYLFQKILPRIEEQYDTHFGLLDDDE